MFEDSDSDMLDASGCVPTPPASVQPHLSGEEEGYTKVIKRDPPGNLPSDQLHQMFPTPPSHEHPSQHSPGDGGDDPRTPGSAHVKQEPSSPRAEYGAYSSGQCGENIQPNYSVHPDLDSYFDHTVMLATSKFAPLPPSSLPSHCLPPLLVPDHWRYKPSPSHPPSPQPSNTQPSNPHVSLTSLKPGLSPISPSPSLDLNPRSNKSGNPGSCDPGLPRSVGPTTPRSGHHPLTPQHPGEVGPNPSTTPPANALTINLVLSDSLLNLYRDINFNSCTMCVCTNDGNIKV
jgi:mediator of RNA polymerase II transcription subunit 13